MRSESSKDTNTHHHHHPPTPPREKDTFYTDPQNGGKGEGGREGKGIQVKDFSAPCLKSIKWLSVVTLPLEECVGPPKVKKEIEPFSSGRELRSKRNNNFPYRTKRFKFERSRIQDSWSLNVEVGWTLSFPSGVQQGRGRLFLCSVFGPPVAPQGSNIFLKMIDETEVDRSRPSLHLHHRPPSPVRPLSSR